jgi:hypothetical protein
MVFRFEFRPKIVQRSGALRRKLEPFAKSEPKPYRFIQKVDVESSRYLMRVRIERPLPVEWSLIVGDFVQNLRAALDHLAWQLVRANGHSPGRGTAFPIFDSKPSRKSRHPDRQRWNANVAGMHPRAIWLIEAVQPYNGPDGARAHTLAALRRLSNEDKHRVLLPRFVAPRRPEGDLPIDVIPVRDVKPIQGGRLHIGRALKDNDLVLDADVEITGPNPQVEAKGEIPVDIAFGGSPVPLVGLEQMRQSVMQFLAVCERECFGS